MTFTVFEQPSASGSNLNPGAQEFVPTMGQQQPKKNEMSTTKRIDTAWGDECGDQEWGDQTWNNENQWELQVNRMSAQWGQTQPSPVKSRYRAVEWEQQLNQVPLQRVGGWEDKANLMSSIWSHTPEFDDHNDAAFQPPDSSHHLGSMSPMSVAETSFLEFQHIAATPCTARLLATLQDALALEIPYAIITDFLLAYVMIKPTNGRDFFFKSELNQVCLPFWGPIMAEHDSPIRVRYMFDRIRENVEWSQVCTDYQSKVELLWVGTTGPGNGFAATESLRITPGAFEGSTVQRKIHPYAKDSRTPMDLSPISSLMYLENIVLHALPVYDISKLVGLSLLRELNLSKTLVENFAPLSDIVSLEQLDVHGTKFNDLTCLPSSSLTSLRANDTHVQDLSSLVFCQKLSLLELSGCPVQNLEPLAVLRSLKNLYLSKTAVFDIYPLSAIATLKFLDLSYTCVSDVHALGISLTQHRALEYVNLAGTAVTDFAPVRSICVVGKSLEDSTEEWGSIQ